MELLNRAVRDVEVNPKAIGRDFEFFVFEGIGGIGLEKSLGNIAVPELVAPAVFSCVGVEIQIAVIRLEAEKQSSGRPEQAHFSGPARIGVLTAPVLIEVQGRRRFPSRFLREAVSVRLLLQAQSRGGWQILFVHLGIVLR